MRCVAFLPLAFVADVEGFTWFMAYAATLCAIMMVGRKALAHPRNAISPAGPA